MKLAFLALSLMCATAQVLAQVPSTLTISKSGSGAPVLGNLGMTTTTRPPSTSTQQLTFMAKGTDFFYGGLGPPASEGQHAKQWYPKGHQLWVILRGSSVADGRGLLIGNIHQLAISDPGSGACSQTGISQIALFSSSTRLYVSSCSPQVHRFVDDRWYKFQIQVNDSKLVKYWAWEVTSSGTIIKTIVSGLALQAFPLPGNPDPSIAATGVGIGATDSPADATMLLEIKNVQMNWL